MQLPQAMQEKIASYLGMRDLCCLSLTCAGLQHCIEDLGAAAWQARLIAYLPRGAVPPDSWAAAMLMVGNYETSKHAITKDRCANMPTCKVSLSSGWICQATLSSSHGQRLAVHSANEFGEGKIQIVDLSSLKSKHSAVAGRHGKALAMQWLPGDNILRVAYQRQSSFVAGQQYAVQCDILEVKGRQVIHTRKQAVLNAGYVNNGQFCRFGFSMSSRGKYLCVHSEYVHADYLHRFQVWEVDKKTIAYQGGCTDIPHWAPCSFSVESHKDDLLRFEKTEMVFFELVGESHKSISDASCLHFETWHGLPT